MRKYEVMYILVPNLDEEGVAAAITRTDELIKSQEAELVSTDKWGKRRLAYEINDYREGFYVLTKFNATVAAKEEIDRKMKLDEEIVRHMIIRLED